jgi:inhibitor of KinA sporulation pathway (predicted exonuclease)
LSGAPNFSDALRVMKDWMYKFADCVFCSWGDYDKNQFLQDCGFHHISYPFASTHLNLKAEFSRSIGLKKKVGIGGALKHLGLEFEGSHHRGLDDARNIARIVRKVCTGG